MGRHSDLCDPRPRMGRARHLTDRRQGRHEPITRSAHQTTRGSAASMQARRSQALRFGRKQGSPRQVGPRRYLCNRGGELPDKAVRATARKRRSNRRAGEAFERPVDLPGARMAWSRRPALGAGLSSAAPRPCLPDGAAHLTGARRALPLAECEHASVRLLAGSLLTIGSKRNSPAIERSTSYRRRAWFGGRELPSVDRGRQPIWGVCDHALSLIGRPVAPARAPRRRCTPPGTTD